MNLTDTDYKILKLVKRKGPLDLTAIRSSLPKESISEQRLRQMSVPPYICRGHPEYAEDTRMLIRESSDGTTRYALAPLGKQALRDRYGDPWRKVAIALLIPLAVSILDKIAERWLIPMLPEIPRILQNLLSSIADLFS